MKKENIINLVKYHEENNEAGFRSEVYKIAKEFDNNGDNQLSDYLLSLVSETNVFRPQIFDVEIPFLKKVKLSNEPFPLPQDLSDDILGIINAIKHNAGVNKFLFYGDPGTGKTESAKHIARILNKDLYMVDFDLLIDSELGQTSKNIKKLFDTLNCFSIPENAIVMFDEIDALALDRTNNNDVREMGRATTAVFKGLDTMPSQLILIATTNLIDYFDKALTRRFDALINFNRYTNKDLIEVSEVILDSFSKKFIKIKKDNRFFKKILSIPKKLPNPGDLKNIIKTSIAFSDPNNEYDYLRKLYKELVGNFDLNTLHNYGFTLREIETLTGIPKSTVAIEIKKVTQ